MRRFVLFLLLGALLALPAVGQREGDGFHGQRVVGPRDYGYTSPIVAAPTKVTEYRGPDLICPQTNGKPLYRIAIPAGKPGQYQNNIWVAHDYSSTNGILNFVTQQGEQKQTLVSSIDSAITLQLNRECGLNVQFPK